MDKKSYVNWRFASENVQSEIVNGQFVSSESTLVLGGPSRLAHLAAGAGATLDAVGVQTTMFPIGLLQNISMAQNRQVNRMFEVGSKRAYFIPGRLFANFSISRILFFGPSLLRMLYAVAPYRELGAGKPFRVEGREVTTPADYARLFGDSANQRALMATPGYGDAKSGAANRDFFVNLASDLFNVPMGLCLLLKDPKNRPYGAMYLEDCYIEAHSMGVDSNNIVIAEQVSGQVGQVAPVQLVTAGL